METTPMEIGLGLLWFVVFVVSTTFHEATHGFAGLRFGDRTAYDAGLVTLDPIPHIQRSPFGMLLVPILSFALGGWMIGWASTPFDPHWAERWPRRAAWMSLAGPAANLVLLLLAGLAIRGGVELGWLAPPLVARFGQIAVGEGSAFVSSLALLLSVLFTLNLLLLSFNLLPLPPLDGAGALPLLLGERASAVWQRLLRQPVVAILGLVLAWNLFGPIFARVHRFALDVLYSGLRFE